jgi:hypothetical protein
MNIILQKNRSLGLKSIFMSISFSLYQLQKIDSQIQESEKQLAAIRKEMESDPVVAEALKILQTSQDAFLKIKGEIDYINQEIHQRKVKIEQSESALYSGNEKNPKMLQDLQTEIGSLKNQIVDFENELLDKLIEQDTAELTLRNKKLEFDVQNTKFYSVKAQLTSERDNLLKKIDRLKVERDTAVTQITSDYLREYERLAASKQGIAVGTIMDDSCSVCGTTFTPAQCQSAKSQSALFYCPTCHRIIYGD